MAIQQCLNILIFFLRGIQQYHFQIWRAETTKKHKAECHKVFNKSWRSEKPELRVLSVRWKDTKEDGPSSLIYFMKSFEQQFKKRKIWGTSPLHWESHHFLSYCINPPMQFTCFHWSRTVDWIFRPTDFSGLEKLWQAFQCIWCQHTCRDIERKACTCYLRCHPRHPSTTEKITIPEYCNEMFSDVDWHNFSTSSIGDGSFLGGNLDLESSCMDISNLVMSVTKYN